MTNEPSPRPWRVNSVTGGHISDANGDPVCFCVGSGCGERAEFIVAAVNERDQIRDAIRDICNTARHSLGYLNAVAPREAFLNIAPSDLRNIVEIARAAIGEDKA